MGDVKGDPIGDRLTSQASSFAVCSGALGVNPIDILYCAVNADPFGGDWGGGSTPVIRGSCWEGVGWGQPYGQYFSTSCVGISWLFSVGDAPEIWGGGWTAPFSPFLPGGGGLFSFFFCCKHRDSDLCAKPSCLALAGFATLIAGLGSLLPAGLGSTIVWTCLGR